MKLPAKRLRELKEEILAQVKSPKELAKEYGVDYTTIVYHRRNLGRHFWEEG